LKNVLRHRLGSLRSLWYEIEFRDIRVHDQIADVDVFLNGSFELASQSSGDRYRRVNDYHRFVLEKQGDSWKFLSGM
jgi:Txe/YoeB family toxin of Txe-Axe toxin-antitoxin module